MIYYNINTNKYKIMSPVCIIRFVGKIDILNCTRFILWHYHDRSYTFFIIHYWEDLRILLIITLVLSLYTTQAISLFLGHMISSDNSICNLNSSLQCHLINSQTRTWTFLEKSLFCLPQHHSTFDFYHFC